MWHFSNFLRKHATVGGGWGTPPRVAPKPLFLFTLHLVDFPIVLGIMISHKKIRSLAQFFRSAQLTWIFWLFDVLLLYEYCQNMHQNPCFWENCLFRAKNTFYPKTKVVPETLRNSWFHDKKITKKNYFLGDLWGPKNSKKAQNYLIHEPLTPPKENIFENFIFSSVLQ